ncbi:hypothetical protein PS947_02387 [Pseudomonas fluorescens]|nr:hypothetical protein PS947_02387 [Pseudomonas fluorescens]
MIVQKSTRMIVPTLRVGMHQGTLRVPASDWDAERPGLHSHAERGNDLFASDAELIHQFHLLTGQGIELAADCC